MTKTRKPVDSMAFYGPDGFHQAWGQASLFAAEGGRVATLPDVIDARIASPDGRSAPWSAYLTTSTSEFLGATKGGVPVVAVLHGRGPLSTREGIAEAYAWQYRDKTRRREGGRVSRETFLAILEHEDVAVVETDSFLNRLKYPMSSMTADEALGDPLLAARFGGQDRLERYVAVHRGLADEDRRKQASERAPRRDVRAPRILRSSDSSNCGYYRWDDFDTRSRTARLPEDGQALAHLLSIGQLSNVGESDEPHFHSLQSDVSVHDWNDGTRFLAFRAGAEPGDFRTAIGHRRAVLEPLLRTSLWREGVGPADGRGFHALMKVGEEFYTQTPKAGIASDTVEPRHQVRTIERIGDTAVLDVETAGYHAFFRYAVSDVEAIAPEGANAYRLSGNPEAYDGGNRQRCDVVFFRVEVDTGRRLATEDELSRDYGLLVKLTEQAA